MPQTPIQLTKHDRCSLANSRYSNKRITNGFEGFEHAVHDLAQNITRNPNSKDLDCLAIERMSRKIVIKQSLIEICAVLIEQLHILVCNY